MKIGSYLEMTWSEAVTKIEANIRDYIKQAKKEGTVGMSVGNLQQVVPTTGVSLPNPNAYYRAFNEAVEAVRKNKPKIKFDIYESERNS